MPLLRFNKKAGGVTPPLLDNTARKKYISRIMPYKIEKNENNKVTVILTIPKEEVETGMKHAAKHISEDTKIPGFRPGKAPYDVVKKRVGEMKLLEAASEELIRTAFLRAMIEEDLETVGQPYFDAEKMAPGNDMVVKAEIALYPHVIELANIPKLSVKQKDTTPTEELIKRAKKDLAMMQTKEVRASKDHGITQGDKAVMSLTMKKDGVVLEGGEGQNHGVYTGEEYYIEGFKTEIMELKEGEEKTFTLKFPDEHYQKHLAGRDIDFTVKINEIFELDSPDIDDDFAKTVGLKDLKELDEKIIENLKRENEAEEQLRLDKEVLDLVSEKTKFEEIPDILVNQEVEKMLHELKHNISQKGMDFDTYLSGLNKSIAELKLDFTPTGLKRVQVAILLKEVAKQEKIKPEEKEIDEELDRIAEQHKDEKTKKKIFEPIYRDYIAQQMRNRKTIEFIKGKIVK